LRLGDLASKSVVFVAKASSEGVAVRVLLVEDEPGIARFVCQGLREEGYAVDWARDGKDGLAKGLSREYDIVLLDILLPGISGLQVLDELRQAQNQVPVLLLTALDDLENRVKGLDSGADDYLAKPFAFPELLARIRALLRRPPLQTEPVLKVGDLEMDVAGHKVRRQGALIDLSTREYALLEYLMRHPRQVLTRGQIAQHVWSFDSYYESNVIDVYIGYLRKKIDPSGGLIRTVRGVGYVLDPDAADQ
jgi:DNA-binding response OmpR family regulator